MCSFLLSFPHWARSPASFAFHGIVPEEKILICINVRVHATLFFLTRPEYSAPTRGKVNKFIQITWEWIWNALRGGNDCLGVRVWILQNPQVVVLEASLLRHFQACLHWDLVYFLLSITSFNQNWQICAGFLNVGKPIAFPLNKVAFFFCYFFSGVTNDRDSSFSCCHIFDFSLSVILNAKRTMFNCHLKVLLVRQYYWHHHLKVAVSDKLGRTLKNLFVFKQRRLEKLFTLQRQNLLCAS